MVGRGVSLLVLLFGSVSLSACRVDGDVEEGATRDATSESPSAGSSDGAGEEPILEIPGEDPRLVAARHILASVRHCALVTVDELGQPRARTVDPRPPDREMVIWLVTRALTRKVTQIEEHDRVTLHCADPSQAEYVSLMGRATIHRDPEVIRSVWHPAWDPYYPDRPDDAVVIEVEPSRVEVLGRGLEPDPVTWEPQGVDLPRPE